MLKTIVKTVKYLVFVLTGLMLILATLYYYRLSQRPAQSPLKKTLWQGISYQRIVKKTPRNIMIHLVSIDLSAKGIHFLVSPPGNPETFDINAQRTSHFLQKYKLQVAINGSFFRPFHSHGPFDYYPHEGDPVDVLGLAISSAKTYSDDFNDWAVFCANKTRVSISQTGCPEQTRQAIAGKQMIVKQGKRNTKNLTGSYATSAQPRSAIALNKEQNKVWFVVVDGRQKNYSEGINLNELANLLLDIGAYNAINLDGGGSSTLVTQQASGKALLLNAPFHTKIPMHERPVANHLGVYALPADSALDM